METTIMGYIRVILGIMENKMETKVYGGVGQTLFEVVKPLRSLNMVRQAAVLHPIKTLRRLYPKSIKPLYSLLVL